MHTTKIVKISNRLKKVSQSPEKIVDNICDVVDKFNIKNMSIFRVYFWIIFQLSAMHFLILRQ